MQGGYKWVAGVGVGGCREEGGGMGVQDAGGTHLFFTHIFEVSYGVGTWRYRKPTTTETRSDQQHHLSMDRARTPKIDEWSSIYGRCGTGAKLSCIYLQTVFTKSLFTDDVFIDGLGRHL